jgi:hypothetical protein
MALVETYWVSSGQEDPPFLDNKTTSYIHSPWINSIKEYLQEINAQIVIPSLPSLPKLRQHDTPIMQQLFTTTLSKSTIEMVNAWRMHLQVHSLAEITNHQGTSILECALYGIQEKTIFQDYGNFRHPPFSGLFNHDHQLRRGKHGSTIYSSS